MSGGFAGSTCPLWIETIPGTAIDAWNGWRDDATRSGDEEASAEAEESETESADDDGTTTEEEDRGLLKYVPTDRHGGYRPYGYAFLLLFVDHGMFQTYKELVGRGHVYKTAPISLALPVLVLLGVGGILYMRNEYSAAIEKLDIEDRADNPDDFETLLPRWRRWAVYGLALLVYYANVYVNEIIQFSVGFDGPILGPFITLVWIPAAWIPIIAEFVTVFVGIQYGLPMSIRDAGVDLDFLDPWDLGGMRPVGTLLLRSAVMSAAGLLLYVVLLYAPHVFSSYFDTPYPEPGPLLNVVFTFLWVAWVFSVVFALFVLHRYMRAKRDDKLKNLRDDFEANYGAGREVKFVDAVENPSELTKKQIQLQNVKDTAEYPLDTTMLEQVVLALVVPKLVQMGVQSII